MTTNRMRLAAVLAGAVLVLGPAGGAIAEERGARTGRSGERESSVQRDGTRQSRESSVQRDGTRQSRDIEDVRTRGLAAIDKRLETLRRLDARVFESEHLSDAHEDALVSLLAAQTARLTELRSTIAAETDPAALREEVKSIATTFRVYLLTVPKVHLVIASGRMDAMATKLDGIAERIEQAILEAEGDTTAAKAALDAMKTSLAAARQGFEGVPDAVLALVPQDWPDNRGDLAAARTSLREARHDLREARHSARDAVEALKAQ